MYHSETSNSSMAGHALVSRQSLESVLGPVVKPRDINLYVEALAHRSATKETGLSQERLEHLGDSVLSLCVTDMLFKKYRDEAEGSLSRRRTRLVNGVFLAHVGKTMGLDRIVITGKNATHPHQDRLYEDTFEALVGAVYLDIGLTAAKQFVAYHVDNAMDVDTLQHELNYRETLRHILAKRGMQLAQYTTTEQEGLYTATITVGDVLLSTAEGMTKKRAEMLAAQHAIETHFSERRHQ